MEITFLASAEVIRINKDQINRYGGLLGVRDLNLLESALANPMATFEGQFLHGDIFQMAGAYAYSIIKNHPFLDGNKRTGLITALLFLACNGYLIEESDALYNMAVKVADGTCFQDEVAQFFKNNAIKLL